MEDPPATSASFFVPGGLATDAEDNLYVADGLNNRIRKVTPKGTISTIAGNGRAGFSGDGGPATQAMLNGPSDLAADQAGNLYLIDFGNLRIRQVTPDGMIKTVGGLAYGGALDIEGQFATKIAMDYSWGLAIDSAGNLYVSSGVYVYRINTAGVLTILGGRAGGVSGGFRWRRRPRCCSPLEKREFLGEPTHGIGNRPGREPLRGRIRATTASAGLPTRAPHSVREF